MKKNSAYSQIRAFNDTITAQLLASLGSKKFKIGDIDYQTDPLSANHTIEVRTDEGYIQLCYQARGKNGNGSVTIPNMVKKDKDFSVWEICLLEVENATQVLLRTFTSLERNDMNRQHNLKEFSHRSAYLKCGGY